MQRVETDLVFQSDKKFFWSTYANNTPMVVAEVSGNHGGSKEKFLELICAASKVADAVKIQVYEADDMFIPSDICFNDHGPWHGQNVYELYKKAATHYEWADEAFKMAKDKEIFLFASAFSYKGADLLASHNCPAYKIASFEVEDRKFIQYCALKMKPIIISCGTATTVEIQVLMELVATAFGNNQIGLLHCNSGYYSEAPQLNRMDTLKAYTEHVGFSDHTHSNIAAIIAASKGAFMIEKHITISSDTADSSFSLTLDQFDGFYSAIKYAARATPEKHITGKKPGRQYNRTLMAVKPIKAGELITFDNCKPLRYGGGASPYMIKEFVGRPVYKDIEIGEGILEYMIQWN